MSAWVIIVNPIHPSGLSRLAEVTAHLGLSGARWSVQWTTKVREGAEQAESAVHADVDRVIVIGGDGTVRSVASALRGTGVPLQVIPTGTANLFARSLGIRPGPVGASALVSDEVRKVDVGIAMIDTVRGRPAPEVFLAAAGMGHDARTIMALGDRLKGGLGWPSYLVSGIRYLQAPGESVQVEWRAAERHVEWRAAAKSGRFNGRVWSVLAGNFRATPAGIRVFPHGGPDTGDLELLLCTARSPGDWVQVAQFGLGLRASQPPGLEYHRIASAIITPEAPAPIHLDGEPIPGVTELRLTLDPGALHMVV